jgi:hypothetical protein
MFFATTKHIMLNICPTGDDHPLRFTNNLVWTFTLAFELQKAHGPLLWVFNPAKGFDFTNQ